MKASHSENPDDASQLDDQQSMNTKTPGVTDAQTPDKVLFLNSLKQYLGSEQLIETAEELKPFECDGLSAYRNIPWLVALPKTNEEVLHILRLCHQHRIPVVPRGAGTGLSGGALPASDGLLLSLTRLNRIIEVDPANRRARVQPGVRNLAISEAAKTYGLYYAPDPSSQVACSIGGNVAENSGGVHCLKYGLTVHNILELRFATMDGELHTVGGAGLDSAGYDLLALLNGSEGLLGVVLEVVVRLLPNPPHLETVLAAFDTVEKAGDAVAAIIAGGLLPAGLELMDKTCVEAVEAFIQPGYPGGAAAILLCELDGSHEQVQSDCIKAETIFSASGAMEIRRAKNEAERKSFWAGRKAAFPALGRMGWDYYCMDGTIPRHRLAEVLNSIGELSDRYGLKVANVFHAGDGNLHPLIMYHDNQPGELEKAEQLGADILNLCIAAGGTITGEHGVGVEKLDAMCVQFSNEEIAQFHAVKSAFDADGLLNPGKAIPSLHRCAELGRMHVHGGQLPHPELDRF